ncbi:MAG: hypothetical protein ACXWV4_09580 [Flavitalea sp.]
MRILLVIGCLLSFTVQAQDLSGIWRGHFRSANGRMLQMLGEDDRYKFEVQIDQRSKNFTGVTYSYKTTVFYGKAICNGTINPATKKVFLEELKIVEVKMVGGDACIMTCFLQYSKSGDEEFLEGNYSSINEKDSTNCGKGTVFLRKVPTSDFYKEPFLIAKEKEAEKKKSPPVVKTIPKKETPKPAPQKNSPPVVKKPTPPPVVQKPVPPVSQKPVPPAPLPQPKTTTIDSSSRAAAIKKPKVPLPPVIASRENEVVKTINTGKGKITISLYDNGTIDNDTVSVYLNNKLVLSKKRLTTNPLSFTFEVDEENDEMEVVMVAENLGEIPPNTSLMVVKANGQQYDIRITSTEQKNAVVRFRLNQTP